MESSPSSVDKIFECRDLCGAITQAYYLMESVKDAMGNHWGEERLIDHIAFLFGEYEDKMKELLPTLNTALEDTYQLAKEEALAMEKYKLNHAYQTDTVG